MPDTHHDRSNGWLLLEEAGLPACAVDCRLRYRRANAAWLTFLQGDTFRYGTQAISLADREILPDLPRHRRERWASALEEIVGGRRSHFFDRSVETSAVGERLIVTAASPTLDGHGQIDGVLCIRYDVTEARHAALNEERLTRVLLTSRRLQHFLGNQLALTMGYVELLTFDPRLPDELRDRVDEALRGVIEATETLSRLRLVTRLELAVDDPSLADHLSPADPP